MTPDPITCRRCGTINDGIWGLRCHPKFALIFHSFPPGGEPQQWPIYAHEDAPLICIYLALDPEVRRYSYFQRWEADRSIPGSNDTGWEGYTPAAIYGLSAPSVAGAEK